jgi:hypothetical protein
MAKKLVAAGPASEQKPAPSALTLTPAPLPKKSGHYERTVDAEKQLPSRAQRFRCQLGQVLCRQRRQGETDHRLIINGDGEKVRPAGEP